MLTKSTFHVDTKGFCFFCLDEVGGTGTNSSLSSYSYRTLARYLGLDLEKVYNCSTITSRYSEVLNKTEFIVCLCPECLSVMKTFSDLHQQLEVTRMKMITSVQKIHGVITCATEEQSRMERCREKMITNPVDIFQIGIIENLRKETVDQCESKIKSMHGLPKPVLLLNRKDADQHQPSTSTSTTPTSTPTSTASVRKAKKDLLPKQNRRRLGYYKYSDDSSSSESESEKSYFRFPSTPPVVDVIISEGEEGHSEPDMNHKKSTVQKKNSRKRVSSSSSEASSGSSGSTSSSSKRAKVLPPPSTKKMRSSVDEDKIIKRQENRKSDKLSKADAEVARLTPAYYPDIKNSSGTFTCKFCTELFPDRLQLRLHIVDAHCHTLFRKFKRNDLRMEDFKLVVKQALKLCSGLDEEEDDRDFVQVKWICKYPRCHMKTIVRTSEKESIVLFVRRHLVDYHFPKVCKKLAQIQNEPDPLKETVRTVTHANSSKGSKPPMTPMASFKCVCGMSFKLSYYLRRHQIKNCQVLLEGQSNNISPKLMPISKQKIESSDSSSSDYSDSDDDGEESEPQPKLPLIRRRSEGNTEVTKPKLPEISATTTETKTTEKGNRVSTSSRHACKDCGAVFKLQKNLDRHLLRFCICKAKRSLDQAEESMSMDSSSYGGGTWNSSQSGDELITMDLETESPTSVSSGEQVLEGQENKMNVTCSFLKNDEEPRKGEEVVEENVKVEVESDQAVKEKVEESVNHIQTQDKIERRRKYRVISSDGSRSDNSDDEIVSKKSEPQPGLALIGGKPERKTAVPLEPLESPAGGTTNLLNFLLSSSSTEVIQSTCKDCGAVFKLQRNLDRHLLRFCKGKKSLDQEEDSMNVDNNSFGGETWNTESQSVSSGEQVLEGQENKINVTNIFLKIEEEPRCGEEVPEANIEIGPSSKKETEQQSQDRVIKAKVVNIETPKQGDPIGIDVTIENAISTVSTLTMQAPSNLGPPTENPTVVVQGAGESILPESDGEGVNKMEFPDLKNI